MMLFVLDWGDPQSIQINGQSISDASYCFTFYFRSVGVEKCEM